MQSGDKGVQPRGLRAAGSALVEGLTGGASRGERLRRPRRVRHHVRRPDDSGFSMLEVVVAIAIFGMAMAAVGPQMIASTQASGTAKLVSQAKGVLQGQLDAMRTLPFRVSPSAGDHRDLLDTYYRDLTPPAAVPACGTATPNEPLAAWTGYVSASNSARCSYEQTGGAFYRKVIAPGTGGLPTGFAVVLNTTFVAATVQPLVVAPNGGYTSQFAGADRPPSSQVGVTATVLYSAHGRWKPITAYTQIASRTVSETRIKVDARATAVEVGAARTTGESITLTAGRLELNGSLSTTSQARANLSAFGAASSLTGRREGAALAVQAPYTNPGPLYAAAGGLAPACTATCWAPSSIPSFIVGADHALPRAGVTGSPGVLTPVQTEVPETLTNAGFQFRAADPVLPGLSSTLVSMDPLGAGNPGEPIHTLANCAFPSTAAASHLTGSGFINSTDETTAAAPLSVEACAGAHNDVVRVLPTSFAPKGLLRITARSAARCRVAGLAHTPSTEVSYRAEVEYWAWTPGVYGSSVGHGEYLSAGIITPGTTSDPLAAISLSTPVSDTEVLGDYVESLTGLTSDRVLQAATGHVAEVTVPALVAVQTRPVAGPSHPGTAVSVAVGAASCRAEDNR